MIPLSIHADDNLLIIAPHPDDKCIGVGGLLDRYAKQSTVWVLSDGRIGQGDHSASEEIRIRREEFQREMDFSGTFAYRLFNLEDGALFRYLRVLETEDLLPYSAIFVTSAADGHIDHSAALKCVINALSAQRLDTPVYLYEVHRPLLCPTHFLDISDSIGRKQRMIAFHQSQLTMQRYDEMAMSLAAFRGHQNRMSGRFIEVFELYSGDVDENNLELMHVQNELQKQRLFYSVLTKWLDNIMSGKSISKRLLEMGYRSVVIYGYAQIGRLLCKELIRDHITVLYALDKRLGGCSTGETEVLFPSPELQKPDAVIVTAPLYFEEIRNELTDQGYNNILSIKSLVEEME